MGKSPQMSKSEWSIMDALWQERSATATDVQGMLEDTQGWAYSTVKTLLDRLVEKGCVKARRVGNVYEYSAKVKRPTAVRRVVDDIVDRLFDGSVAPFIQRLIERRALTAEEADELRDMLENYTGKRKGEK